MQQFTLASAVVQLSVNGQQSFYAALSKASQQAQRTQQQFAMAARQAQTSTGQQMFQRLYAAQLAQQNHLSQANAAQLNAQANYLKTPAGQAAWQASQASQAQQAAAQQRLAHQQNVASYGTVNANLMKFGAGLKTAAAELLPVVGAIAGIGATAYGIMNHFGSIANPMAGGTLSGSWTLASARMGGAFSPAMDAISSRLQRANMPRGMSDQLGLLGSAAVEIGSSAVIGDYRGILRGIFSSNTERRNRNNPELQSLEGMPEAGMSSYADYGNRLQMSALQTDPLQTAILRQQMQNMEQRQQNMPPEMRVLLERIADNTMPRVGNNQQFV